MSPTTRRDGHHVAEVLGDVVRYGLMAAIAQASGILLLPILTRWLSVEDYGILEITAVLVGVLSIAQGFRETLRRTGAPDAVIVMRATLAMMAMGIALSPMITRVRISRRR